jgi:DNA gyrase subunit B
MQMHLECWIKFDISGMIFVRTNGYHIRKVAEPQFEGQTKTKLGNREVVSPVSQAVVK